MKPGLTERRMDQVLCETLYQEKANYGHGPNPTHLPGFVKRVLLEHSRAHLFAYDLWLLSRYTG